MSKIKYYYDPETLSYQKVERKKRKIFGGVTLFIFFSCLTGFLLYLYAGQVYDSPELRRAKREKQFVEQQLKSMQMEVEQLATVIEDIEDRDNSIYRIYFDATPIPDEQRQAGFGGVNRYEDYEGYDASERIIAVKESIDKLKKRVAIQSKSLDEIAVLAKDKENLLASIPAIQPVRNQDLTRMASGYGYRTDPFNKTRKFHYGMDFTAPRGTPVFATGDGVVDRADANSSGYGNHIRIDHGFGYTTLYAHLRSNKPYNVRRGQRVKRGDIIGYVGSTGRSQAPHLHYEVFLDGERINPINFYYGNLTPEEFNELLKKSQQENISLD
ncbi:M23 family metallopeptidase [Nonlabens ponticola]|uniref:M23 family metallopeptidase n=1 Tax=Nonlabens ponticola TaxID=2496866 RepID=A0A3S9MZR9_9FLAO|nr:M23 family metallopeptidase [Nonlabens ponticola]AZQ44755.1 M23 family metallopeptidase [Nonlabens ponticola]